MFNWVLNAFLKFYSFARTILTTPGNSVAPRFTQSCQLFIVHFEIEEKIPFSHFKIIDADNYDDDDDKDDVNDDDADAYRHNYDRHENGKKPFYTFEEVRPIIVEVTEKKEPLEVQPKVHQLQIEISR